MICSAQIQGLVDALAAERAAREVAEVLVAMIGHELRAPMDARANEKGPTGGSISVRTTRALSWATPGVCAKSCWRSSTTRSNSSHAGRLVLRFDVTDTGVGLSKAVQERLLQPYIQIENKSVGQSTGTGLGL
jgi:signal transduction histidine kinase